ncbi:MAG: hypothetical protein NZ519_00750 [Bacteroidia bacterium]|nr:hypothetical protein [Bacteroidia bacterium]
MACFCPRFATLMGARSACYGLHAECPDLCVARGMPKKEKLIFQSYKSTIWYLALND